MQREAEGFTIGGGLIQKALNPPLRWAPAGLEARQFPESRQGDGEASSQALDHHPHRRPLWPRALGFSFAPAQEQCPPLGACGVVGVPGWLEPDQNRAPGQRAELAVPKILSLVGTAAEVPPRRRMLPPRQLRPTSLL